jgi:hypothetical protein
MSASILSFNDRYTKRQDELAAFKTRFFRARAMYPLLEEAVKQMQGMGADKREIINVFKVSLKELEETDLLEPQNGNRPA